MRLFLVMWDYILCVEAKTRNAAGFVQDTLECAKDLRGGKEVQGVKILSNEASLRQFCSSLRLKSFPIGKATLKELNADLRRAINRGRIRATK